MFKTVIFNASATLFAQNDVLFELLLLCSGLWIHSQNLMLSSHCMTASEHHPTSAWVVLRVDRSAQGKNRTSPSFLTPAPFPPSRPLPFPSVIEVGP